MATSQARFKWTDDKLTNLIKCLQKFKSSSNENLDENVPLPVSKSTPINNKKKKVKNNISINNPAPKLIDNKRKHLERQLRFVSICTFIKFFIYSRLLHFNPGWDFSYNCNFFQLGIPSWNFNPGWKSPYNQPLSR